MSTHPPVFDSIPAEAVRVALAAFPQKNLYMRMRDEFGSLYTDEDLAALFPPKGRPAEDPARLALITIMQFLEGLSDRQAADAVRRRIDWKYALALELTDSGFDASVLSEFRARLIVGHAEHLLFDLLLRHLRQRGLLKARGRQRTDSTHVLAAIRTLNRLECLGETLRGALNTLAVVAPDWLKSWVPAVWFDRYAPRFEEYRLPAGRPERYALAEAIGADGFQLLQALYAPEGPHWLREIPAVQVLRRVWIQQFYAPSERVQWRAAEDLPPKALLLSTPYDAEARYSQRRSIEWTGYKVHVTETCDGDGRECLARGSVVSGHSPGLDSPVAVCGAGSSRHLISTNALSICQQYLGKALVAFSSGRRNWLTTSFCDPCMWSAVDARPGPVIIALGIARWIRTLSDRPSQLMNSSAHSTRLGSRFWRGNPDTPRAPIVRLGALAWLGARPGCARCVGHCSAVAPSP
jgi:transposase